MVLPVTVTPETLVADVIASAELEGGRILPETRDLLLAYARGRIASAVAEQALRQIIDGYLADSDSHPSE